jgi:hypothetical protein
MKQRAKDRAAATQQLGRDSPYVRPFIASPEDALCIFDLRVLVLHLVMDAGGALNMHFQFRHRITFVVHRNALVDLVDIYAEVKEPGSDIVEVTQVDLSHAADGDALAEATLSGEMAGTVGVEEDDTGPDVENTRPHKTIPWAQWGPAVTRWFNSDNVSTHWITTTQGQRCIRMASDPPDDGYQFAVLDFNPVNVKKRQLWLKEQAEKLEEGHEKRGRRGEIPGVGLQERHVSIPNLVAEGIDHITHGDSPEVSTDELLRTWMFAFYAHVGFALTFAEFAPAENADSMSDFHAAVGSDGDSTGSPMIFDDELDTINPDDFLYFPTSNRVQVITQPEQVEPAESFSEAVVGELPYVICASQDKHVYDGVLLDEEWVVGVVVSLFSFRYGTAD